MNAPNFFYICIYKKNKLPVIVDRMNRELSGVVDVTVDWTGGTHTFHHVGRHVVRCSVARLVSAVAGLAVDDVKGGGGAEVMTQCFDVPFYVDDVNECELPADHPMRHECSSPGLCVNTEGGYECACPSPFYSLSSSSTTTTTTADAIFFEDMKSAAAASSSTTTSTGGRVETESDPWLVSLRTSDLSSCPGSASTYGCCDADAHGSDGSDCRSSFSCPVDPCSSSSSSSPSSSSSSSSLSRSRSSKKRELGVKGGEGEGESEGENGANDCSPEARCVRSPSPLSRPPYSCVCPPDLMGSGRVCRSGIDVGPRPAVGYDGVTPTEETVRNGHYCGCTVPVVDACEGYPKCGG